MVGHLDRDVPAVPARDSDDPSVPMGSGSGRTFGKCQAYPSGTPVTRSVSRSEQPGDACGHQAVRRDAVLSTGWTGTTGPSRASTRWRSR